MRHRLIATAAFGAALASSDIGAVRAESPAQSGDFTFRMERPPAAGQRITSLVQIAPTAPAGPSGPPRAGDAATAPRAPGDPAIAGLAPPAGDFDWFWEAVSPDLAAGGPGNLARSTRALSNPPADAGAVPAPRLQGMAELAERYGVEILTATVGTDVSPALVLAVISVESAGRSDAESHAGAQGLMQLMPATAARFGVTDSLYPGQNIDGGVAYLDWLLEEFDNDVVMVLAGYNAGEGAVRDHAGVPPYAETRNYVPKVLAAWQVARGLCVSPPELISDGCVFRTGGG